MKKTIAGFLALLLLVGCDPNTIQSVLNGVPSVASPSSLTNEEVIAGLKQALEKGAESAVSLTSKVDGFNKNELIRIPFPPEAQKVKDWAVSNGLKSQVDAFEENLNKAAEKAAAEATPIFIDAIKSMSIQDGFNILKGEQNAATTFLRNATEQQLYQKFSPIIQNKIDEVKLTSYWEPITKAYNTASIFTGNQQVNTDLKDYATKKALNGLFIYVEKEEKNIRENPAARVTDLLKKVFGQ